MLLQVSAETGPFDCGDTLGPNCSNLLGRLWTDSSNYIMFIIFFNCFVLTAFFYKNSNSPLKVCTSGVNSFIYNISLPEEARVVVSEHTTLLLCEPVDALVIIP